jgi:hypothetical protein
LYEGCSTYYEQQTTKSAHKLVTKIDTGFKLQDSESDQSTFMVLEKAADGHYRGLLAMSNRVFESGYVIENGELPTLIHSILKSKSDDNSIEVFKGGYRLKGIDGAHNPGVFVKDTKFASFEIEESLPTSRHPQQP